MCNPNPNEIGWIRLYRKMTEWRWYGLPNMMAVFIHLLLTANHKDGYSFGVEIKRGQVMTSEDGIMRSIKIKRGALRVCLKKLEETGEIIRSTTNKYSIITICNYDSYQSATESNNQQIAIEQPADEHQPDIKPTSEEHQPATNKNNKNKKNDKNEENERKEESITLQKAKEDFEIFRKAYPGKKRGLDTEFANFKKKHRDWQKVLPLLLPAAQGYAEQTRGKPKEYIKHLQTWINNRCWEIEYSNDNSEQSNGRNQTYRQNGISSAGYGLQMPDGTEYH
ncbi:hypothetical protein EEK90_03365 [Muribaculaceae bacterium Isolate-036 (Harlan)]|nr:hypothetical protein EEK90_03365 [Muribaculaceae bacterium Isolate-036 (Harlan)]